MAGSGEWFFWTMLFTSSLIVVTRLLVAAFDPEEAPYYGLGKGSDR
jgi:hypothetical protein